jgi:hypothetical protein
MWSKRFCRKIEHRSDFDGVLALSLCTMMLLSTPAPSPFEFREDGGFGMLLYHCLAPSLWLLAAIKQVRECSA